MRVATPPDLVLLDVHGATPAPWWPPAPGWWLAFALLLATLAILFAMQRRRRARRRAIEAVFDATLAAAPTPAARVAALSELLRRAARLRDPQADRYVGADWRAHLDAGAKRVLFDDALGALLVEGPFQRDVDAEADATLERRVRQRYLEWMR